MRRTKYPFFGTKIVNLSVPDIAMNIANALEAEFSVEEQERIAQVPTVFLKAGTADRAAEKSSVR